MITPAQVTAYLETISSEPTRLSYRRALARLGEWTTRGFELEGGEALQRRLELLAKRYRPASLAQSLIVLRQLYRYLRLPDPTVGLKAMPVGDNVPADNVLREGELSQLLATVTDPRERAVVTALALQGWRASELCRMTWGQIRPGTAPGTWVAEFRAKRKKLRVQGVQEAVITVVNRLGGKTTPSSPFLPHADGRPFTRFEVYAIVTRASKAFGRPITPHGLRATYISSVINRKGIEAARQLAGHANISTTQRYSRWKIESDDPLTVEDL